MVMSFYYAKLAIIITFFMRKWPLPIKIRQNTNIYPRKNHHISHLSSQNQLNKLN